MSSGGSITRSAHAKLNLALSVGPADDDGYHPISSWMVTINLADDLVVSRLPAGRLSRYAILWHDDAKQRSDIDWSVTKDLAVKAHAALERHAERALPVQMKLAKRIPVAGGLGGGSADAAAMLLATNELFDLCVNEDDLISIARELGADVPFFLRGGSAIVEGRGEQLTAHESVPRLHAVLIMPDALCRTGAVYTRYDELGANGLRASDVRALASDGRQSPVSEALFNDLAAAALHVAPQLRDHMRAISELAERPAHVTGSGSCLFVVCDDPLHAAALAQAVEERVGLPAIAVEAVE